MGINHNRCGIGYSPATPDINPGYILIAPITGDINILRLGWNSPVSRNPYIMSRCPPPIPIDPGMVSVRLLAAVIIHGLTGGGIC